MQVTVEQQGPCEVELNIEIPIEQVSTAREKVYTDIGKHTSIPGFRKGKAPRAILERHLSDETVRRHLLDELLPDAYAQAIKDNDIDPYADPDVDIVQFEADQALIFKAKVPLPPKIELGEYRGIEVERPAVDVTDDDVETEVKNLQMQRGEMKGVEDRPVRSGDMVVMQMLAVIEGEDPGEPRRTVISIGSNPPIFDDQVIGMNLEEERSFTIEYPTDAADESLAGKKVDYTVTVEAIRELVLPEVDDDFAKSLGEYESLDALTEAVRTRLLERNNLRADQEVESRIIEEIVSRSQVSYPEIMVKARIAHHLEHLREDLEQRGRTLKQYLEGLGRTREEFMADLTESYSRRVAVGLVLGQIVEKENLAVTEEEVEAEMSRLGEAAKVPREAVEAYLEPRGGRDGLEEAMQERKISDFILSVSTIKSAEGGAQST